jgi:hypothetical protein
MWKNVPVKIVTVGIFSMSVAVYQFRTLKFHSILTSLHFHIIIIIIIIITIIIIIIIIDLVW